MGTRHQSKPADAQVHKDLMGMRFMAGLVGRIFPEYQYTWLFPEFEETINLELGEGGRPRSCELVRVADNEGRGGGGRDCWVRSLFRTRPGAPRLCGGLRPVSARALSRAW